MKGELKMLDMSYIVRFAEELAEMVIDKVEDHPTTYDEAVLTLLNVERLLHDRVIDLEYERIE